MKLPGVTFHIQVRTVSALNAREIHWARAERVEKEHAATRRAVPPWPFGPVVHVHMVREGPGTLDDDNLTASCKGVRDALAKWMRLDDRSPLVRWTYGQERAKEWQVRVEVRPLVPGLAPMAQERAAREVQRVMDETARVPPQVVHPAAPRAPALSGPASRPALPSSPPRAKAEAQQLLEARAVPAYRPGKT